MNSGNFRTLKQNDNAECLENVSILNIYCKIIHYMFLKHDPEMINNNE